jgi:hypothetical protein
MENLPVIQTTLFEWLQLTTYNLLIVVVLIIGVWLFTASMYSLIIAGLNKKNSASETARTIAETNLNNAQQQLQQAQTELANASEQLAQQQKAAEAEKHRALNAEHQLVERNQQILAIIQRLTSGFDSGEAPLQIIKDLKAEDLWQQHDKVVTKFIEALRTEQLAKTELQKFYQAEKDKVKAAENRLQSLQADLHSQTNQVSTLQIQNTVLQQQQNAAQQALADATQKLADLTQLEQRLPELEQKILQLSDKNVLAVKPVETTVALVQTATPVNVAPIDDSEEKLKNLFKKPQQQPGLEAVIIQTQETTQPESIVTDILVISTDEEPTATETIVVDNAEQDKESSLFKSLFRRVSGKKPGVSKFESEPTPEPNVMPEPESVPQIISQEPETVEEQTEKNHSVSSLKGFYQKFTSKPDIKPELVVKAEPEVAEEIPEKTSGSGLKGFYQKFTTKSEVETKPTLESEPIVVETPVPVTETPEKTDTRKGFSQRFKKPKETKLSDNEPSSRVEDVADKITDTVEGVKNLYGKFFSKNK